MSKKIKLNCQLCGKEFETYPCYIKRGGGKFCSHKCSELSGNSNHGRWDGHVKIIKEKIIKGKRLGSNHHNWTGGKQERKCIVCGDIFYVKREQIKRTGAKFCSFNCRSFYNVRYNRNKFATDIEKIVEDLLKTKSIPYSAQKQIGRVALVDFVIGKNIIIQCDGDYWHGMDRQREHDVIQDKKLLELGYIVCRCLGSDIKKWCDIDVSIKRI